MTNQKAAEARLVTALIALFTGKDAVPTEEELYEMACQLRSVVEYSGDIGHVTAQVMAALVTRMGQGISIVEPDADHDPSWPRNRELSKTYADAYERFLREEAWSEPMVQSLSDVCDRILSHLQDPLSQGQWDRRGLVIGHVQSGKTANYLGLIARAADAGYKFIIVVAGIHNNLRKQTQERVDAGFIGRSSDPNHRMTEIGVGTYSKGYPHPATLTNIDRDFNSTTAANSGWEINDFSKPIIVVIKKWVTVLDSLHGWLKDLNATNGQISDVPMLFIDDEADHASINTAKNELHPTRTNKLVRKILGLFDKSCYVGYTATPFANIFINHEAYDHDDLKELFPRDFIYSLDPPSSYFGAEKIFLDEAGLELHVKDISDADQTLPMSHKIDHQFDGLPGSLREAIYLFIIARAIRNLRGQRLKHCSMMVNVSRFVAIQRRVQDLISVQIREVRNAVLANAALPEDLAQVNSHMAALQTVFERNYFSCGEQWSDLRHELLQVVGEIQHFLINSKSDQILDYKRAEKDGQALTAIAIGGLSLSRGLTIEGLCISYMYRNTAMYDTLMQMGRWFGYRHGYEDLCRIWLDNNSKKWYADIAEKTEELRDQIRMMRRNNQTPRDFGLYVQTHPDRLLITARNKMMNAREIPFDLSYSRKIIESYIVSASEIVNDANEKLIVEFWKRDFGSSEDAVETEKGWFYSKVPIDEMCQFLLRFKVVPGAMDTNRQAAVDYLRAIADNHGGFGDVLLISPKGKGPAEAFRLETQRRSALEVEAQERLKDAWWLSKNRVANRGDEKLGLSHTQRDAATAQAIKQHRDKGKDSNTVSDIHYREQRGKPLLMVHILGPVGEGGAGSDRVPAFGVSFPFEDEIKTVKVMANRVLLNQLLGDDTDSPEDDEDYDEQTASLG